MVTDLPDKIYIGLVLFLSIICIIFNIFGCCKNNQQIDVIQPPIISENIIIDSKERMNKPSV